MNLFENLRLLNEAKKNIEFQNLFEMAKLIPKRADETICGKLDVYIYFSKAKGGRCPRIKFDGGVIETHDSDKAPTMSFDLYGSKDIILQPWMNKKNCPNAFNKKIEATVRQFIDNTLPILLLTWFGRLDEDDSLAFLQGHDTWNEMIDNIDKSNFIKNKLKQINNLLTLNRLCREYALYNLK